MKRIISRFFLPTLFTSLVGSTIVLNNHDTNIKINNLRSENQKKSFETIQMEALSFFIEYYFEDDYKVKFQQEYLLNLQDNLPPNTPTKNDIANEFANYLYKKHKIKIKFEIADKFRNIRLIEGENGIEINKGSIFINDSWIDLLPHITIKISWNNEDFYQWKYTEWMKEMHILYKISFQLEQEISYQDFVGYLNPKARDYYEIIHNINDHFKRNNYLHRVSLNESRSCNSNICTYRGPNKNDIIKNSVSLILSSDKYTIPVVLVNLKSELNFYSKEESILLFVFNQFLFDQNPHINFKSKVNNNCRYPFKSFLSYLNWGLTKYCNENNFRSKLSKIPFITFRNDNDNYKKINEGINILKLWINCDGKVEYDLPLDWTNRTFLVEKKYTRFAIYAISYPPYNHWNESAKRKRINKRWESVETYDPINKIRVKSIKTIDLTVGQSQVTAHNWIKDFIIDNVYSRMSLELASISNGSSYRYGQIKRGRMLFYEEKFDGLPAGGILKANDVETIIHFVNPNVLFEKGINVIRTIIKIDGFKIPVEFCVYLE